MSEQQLNAVFASVRIVGEHALAGVKRCRIVKDVLRLTKAGISDQVLEIACGLHNFRVTSRHPEATYDLQTLLAAA